MRVERLRCTCVVCVLTTVREMVATGGGGNEYNGEKNLKKEDEILGVNERCGSGIFICPHAISQRNETKREKPMNVQLSCNLGRLDVRSELDILMANCSKKNDPVESPHRGRTFSPHPPIIDQSFQIIIIMSSFKFSAARKMSFRIGEFGKQSDFQSSQLS